MRYDICSDSGSSQHLQKLWEIYHFLVVLSCVEKVFKYFTYFHVWKIWKLPSVITFKKSKNNPPLLKNFNDFCGDERNLFLSFVLQNIKFYFIWILMALEGIYAMFICYFAPALKLTKNYHNKVCFVVVVVFV